MPSFDSPLGSKKLAAQSLKEFDIPDESGLTQEQVVNPVFRRKAAMPSLDEAALQNFQHRIDHEFDHSPDPIEIEREFKGAREAKRAKISGRERLNDGAKKRLEMLLDMTRTTHEVNIDGTIFILQTLAGKSMREAIMEASEFDGTVQSPFEVRKQFLARSLISIGGATFSQFVGSDSLEVKLAFIDELHEPLLNKLYDTYLKMTEIAKDKYSIKNENDAREIIEDLKK
jgi:hypothetical protein